MVMDVMQKMIYHKVHRLVVLDSNSSIQSIVHQQNILSLFLQQIDSVHPHPDKTLSDLGLVHKDRKLVFGNERQTILELWEILIHNKISGLPVVNSNNKYVYEVGTSEIKELDFDTFHDVHLPVSAFRKKHEYNRMTCEPTTTLRDLLKMLVEKKR